MSTPEVHLDQYLPASPDTECTLLGCGLLENSVLDQCIGAIEPEDLSLDSNRRIFKRMLDMHMANRSIDTTTLIEELAKHKELDAVGGRAYIFSLTEGLPRRKSVIDYVRIIREKSQLRQVITQATRVLSLASDQGTDAEEIVAEWNATGQVLAEKSVEGGFETFGQFVQKQFPRSEAIYETTAKSEGVPTGYAHFDHKTKGFQKDDLIILAARPSGGKTMLAMNIMKRQGIELGLRPAMFSLEMPKRQLLDILRSSLSGVDLDLIREGDISFISRRYLDEAMKLIIASSIYVDDTRGLTVPMMQARASILKSTVGLDIVYIDQFSHINPGKVERGMTKADRYGVTSKQLKAMAKFLHVPVVVLHQLNRESTKGEEKRPTLSSLKDSGSLEEDADLVCFIHREDYFDQKSESKKTEWIIAKQRMGERCTIPLGHDLARCLFSDDKDWIERQKQAGLW